MHDPTPVAANQRAGRKEWIGFSVLALPALLTSLDMGGLFLALPHLSTELDATSTQQLWISDIYGFTLAGFLVTMGTLGDRIGRRKLILIGAAVFGVVSILAAYSTSPATLIIARAVLGIAGATLMPSTLALVGNIFKDEKQRGTAISWIYTCVMVGSALGPVVGGLLLERFWWGSVFLLGVPFMLLLLVTGPIFVPEYKAPQSGRLDPISVVLSLAAILPVIYGMKQLAAGDSGMPIVPIAAIVCGVVFGIWFVLRQRGSTNPLLDMRLFGNRSLSAVLAALLLAGGCMAGTFLLTSQYIQTVLGYGSATSGLLLAPTGLSIAVGLMLAPSIAKRIGLRIPIVGGLVIGAVGFMLITQAQSSGGLLQVVIGLAIVHFFVGPLLGLGVGVIIGAAPPEKSGSAASLAETSNYLGSMLGMAVLGSIGAAVYRAGVADSIPDSLTPEAARNAHETVAGAVAVAPQLAPDQATPLLDAARDSFASGLSIAGVIGAVVFIGLAALTAITLTPKPNNLAPAEVEHSSRAVSKSIPETADD
ncbi:MFS transporter [Nocardia sp. NPDC057030]|uniref:MFS transporter n=1 Tax=unclassified Nocardia TaxID=2637762 RepID=UPI003629B86E